MHMCTNRWIFTFIAWVMQFTKICVQLEEKGYSFHAVCNSKYGVCIFSALLAQRNSWKIHCMSEILINSCVWLQIRSVLWKRMWNIQPAILFFSNYFIGVFAGAAAAVFAVECIAKVASYVIRPKTKTLFAYVKVLHMLYITK